MNEGFQQKPKRWEFKTIPMKQRDIERIHNIRRSLLPLEVVAPITQIVAGAILKMSRLPKQEVLKLIREIVEERSKD